MSKVDLDALAALEAKAMPGNWKLSHLEMFAHHTDASLFQNTKHQESSKVSLEDKKLIEAMRNALPDMIAELRALRKLADALKKAREEHYCNVPVEVDDALAEYKRLVGDK